VTLTIKFYTVNFAFIGIVFLFAKINWELSSFVRRFPSHDTYGCSIVHKFQQWITRSTWVWKGWPPYVMPILIG